MKIIKKRRNNKPNIVSRFFRLAFCFLIISIISIFFIATSIIALSGSQVQLQYSYNTEKATTTLADRVTKVVSTGVNIAKMVKAVIP